MRKKFVKILWSIIGVILATVLIFFVSIWNGWIGYMPDMEELQNPMDKFASQVYSADGQLIGTYNKASANRIHVGYDSISNHVVQALVATEDVRFYEHSGVDMTALARAVFKRGIMGQESAGGGSTLTQQLAKQLYSEKTRSTFERLMQKPIEWIIAVKLERNFTKEEIVMMYLNQFDFLHNAVGIKNAANTYFSKEPKDLTLEESAMLVGLCKNPAYFNPIRHADRCLERRNVVLEQMVKAGYITKAQYNEASKKPLALKFHRVEHNEGPAPYVREYLRRYMMANKPVRDDYKEWQMNQFIIDSIAWSQDPLYGWCNKNFKDDGTPYNIYEDGLKIYTTIDLKMQKYGEEAMEEHMKLHLQPAFNNEMSYKPNAPYASNLSSADVERILQRSMRQSDRYITMKKAGYSEEEINKSFHQKTEMTIFTYRGDKDTMMTPMDSIKYYKRFLRSGFCSMDAHTGEVKAYVGNINFDHFKYDMVTLGRRQVGSTMKPYVYAMGVEGGMSPCDPIQNSSAYPNWHVKGARGGTVPLKVGLQKSLNGVSTQLMYRYGGGDKVPNFMDLIKRFGVNLPGIEPNPTLCLGSGEVSLIEMCSGYTTFVNHGLHCAPMFVTRIEDSTGKVIKKFEPRMNEAISEASSYKMLIMMRAVVNGGTGGRMRHAYGVKVDMGGKTGTTNSNSDAWFMGITPDLVCGAWVGGEDRDIRFASGAMGQGAAAALPIVAYYLKRLYADKSMKYSPDAKFDIPDKYDPCHTREDDFEGESIEEVFE